VPVRDRETGAPSLAQGRAFGYLGSDVTTISCPPSDRPSILIADDDYDLRDALCEILGEYDFDVLVARDGREALAVMERRLPSLVLLDLTMPEMSGWELLAELERRVDLAAIPVLVFSANEVRVPAGRAFLAKPFRVEQLLERIDTLLGARRPPHPPPTSEGAKS
jgi:DNA-binding response OmpR family regulator